MVSDQPVSGIAQDRLGFDAYATVFCAFMHGRQTPTPTTVAISGPWGSGKTSLARMIDSEVRKRENWERDEWLDPPLTSWFNAWHHADAENVGVALAARAARRLAPERRLWWRVLQPLPVSLLRPGRRWARRVWQGAAAAAVALCGLVALVWAVPGLRPVLGPVGRMAQGGPDAVLVFGAVAAALALASRAFRLGGSIGGYLEEPQAMAAAGAIADVREHLGRLIRQALRRGAAGVGYAAAGHLRRRGYGRAVRRGLVPIEVTWT